jgi:hypothetical protein
MQLEFLTVNEVRESEGMPPINEADLPPITQPVVPNNNPAQEPQNNVEQPVN